MAILVDENTKVLIQGITGSFGATHARLSLEYGTRVVAGVVPGRGGQVFDKVMKDFQRDHWMDAKESVKYGIVDGILS